MGYQDPDSTFTDYEVQVFLERVRKTTGIHQVIAGVDSDNFATSAPNTAKTTFSHTFDFTNYVYYVGIRVNRNDSAGNPTVWFASLN